MITTKQAIDLLKSAYEFEVEKGGRCCGKTNFRTALLMGANALGVLEQVRWERDVAVSQLNDLGLSLGQKVDHVKDTINKQVSMDIIVDPYFYGENYYCPHCGSYIGADHNNLKDVNYCNRCGQKLTMKKQ